MLEIKMHDGPARLGKYEEKETPNVLHLNMSSMLIEDEPMPYNVPRSLAEYSVKQTIQKASMNDNSGVVVIHGSKYTDLRVKCALELENLNKQIMMIANPDELLKRPHDLIEIIVNIRENINPNIALYFPFIKTEFIPLLAYLGIDFYGDISCDFYAQLGLMMTPNTIYDTKIYQIYDYNLEELKKSNHEMMDFVLREVRENIKNGTLRNLVEERCTSSTEAMTALRILDRDYRDYLDKYTQLY